MKRYTLTVLVATIVAICSLQAIRAQELTKEQLAAEQLRQLEALQAQAAAQDRSDEFWASLNPEQRAAMLLRRNLVRANIKNPPLPTNQPPKIKPQSMTASIYPAPQLNSYTAESDDPETDDYGLNIVAKNTSFSVNVTNYLNLGDYTPYGVMPIGDWLTDLYAWSPSTSVPNGAGGSSAQSYDQLPNGQVSWMYFYATNHYDAAGKPRAHILTCWSDRVAPSAGMFRLTINNWQFGSGTSLGVMPEGSWARSAHIIAPFTGSERLIYFTVWRTNSLYGSPRAFVHDSVQYFPYVAWTNGIRVTARSNNIIRLNWDALAWPTQYYHLEYAGNIQGPWASNITPVSIIATNYQAQVQFGTTNGSRFYRLRPH